ncbi:unnamed protein product [Kluyveromyces dobzhanskii CBS 2104]|uniref:WGS project CCBQ000000000 data, contig 00015 n=1 Tax=Kluyveromyces dobzhanskii CBS 2104 TaxID=1427455 RepID=A0A0A8L994_9SACH|nr:unnamed protein product [Kluyveromyces dobzhanskii CBS 2104]
MSHLKVVSRNELFGTKLEASDTSDSVFLPKLDFEFVEVEDNGKAITATCATEVAEDTNSADEFDFPLFSFGSLAETSNLAENDPSEQTSELGAKTTPKLMKVSLREPKLVDITVERPRSYYYSCYSESDKEKFSKAAVTADYILNGANLLPFAGWSQYRGKVINIDEHNSIVSAEHTRSKRLQKRRPGKRQRLARSLGKQRVEERIKQDADIKKILKKKFHKRGGKKNKRKAANPLADAGSSDKP